MDRHVVRHVAEEPVEVRDERFGVGALGDAGVLLLEEDAAQAVAEELGRRFEELPGEGRGVEVRRIVLVARTALSAASERACGVGLRRFEQEAGVVGRVLGVGLEHEVVRARLAVVFEERAVKREVDF